MIILHSHLKGYQDNGRVIIKLAPLYFIFLYVYSLFSTSILPSILFTIKLYVILSPRPVPCDLYFVVKYGSNILSIISFGIPKALSLKNKNIHINFSEMPFILYYIKFIVLYHVITKF